MTDNSLPTSQSVPQNSYVDSYVPPTGAGQSTAQPTQPAQPVEPTQPVESTQPPQPTQPASSALPVAQPSPATPATPALVNPTSTPTLANSDPLAELEKALQDYEERQKQQRQDTKQVVKQAEAVKQTTDKTAGDPLVELERVLDEYEARYKQQNPDLLTTPPQANADQANISQPNADQANLDQPNVKPTVPKTATTDAGETISQEEYQSVLKNEPIKKRESIKSAEPSNSAPKDTLVASNQLEPIEEQNIFELLGVMDSETAEKEAFLDELQQALWDDFLDKDLQLLITAEQLKEIQQLREGSLPDGERQSQLIAKVEALVPDLEEIMLEKALELKEEMVKERLAGMKEYFADRKSALDKIQEAEQHLNSGRWQTGAQLLNTLTA